MFAILRQRNFALLTAGQMISKLGDWLLWIGLPFHIYEQTNSPMATGIMFVMPTLPAILFGSLAGVFVDRHDRKQLMVVTDLLRALIVGLLLFIPVGEHLWLVYLLVFLEATVAQFFYPAKSALVPRLVGQTHLLAANRITSVGDDLMNLIGPALGGLLPTLLGIHGIILLDAATFLLSALCVGLIISPIVPTTNATTSLPAAKNIWQTWRQTFELVKSQRFVAGVFSVMAVAMFGQGIISVCWIVFVLTVLQAGPSVYGWVQVAVALGGLVGAVLLGRASERFAPAKLIGLGGLATGLLLLATFNWPVLSAILALQLLNGVAAIGFFVPIETLLQAAAPDTELGRIFGTYHMINGLAMLAGQTVGSLLALTLGVTALLNGAALLYVVAGIVALFSLSAARHGSEALLRQDQLPPAILE